MTDDKHNTDNGNLDEALLTAYALGQLDGEERAQVERLLAESADAERIEHEVRVVADHVREAYRRVPETPPSSDLRAAIESYLDPEPEESPMQEASPNTEKKRFWRRPWLLIANAACLFLLVSPLAYIVWQGQKTPDERMAARLEADLASVDATYDGEGRPESGAGFFEYIEGPVGEVSLPNQSGVDGKKGQDPMSHLNVFPTVTEEPAGSFRFQTGVNSEAGLIGSVVIDESGAAPDGLSSGLRSPEPKKGTAIGQSTGVIHGWDLGPGLNYGEEAASPSIVAGRETSPTPAEPMLSKSPTYAPGSTSRYAIPPGTTIPTPQARPATQPSAPAKPQPDASHLAAGEAVAPATPEGDPDFSFSIGFLRGGRSAPKQKDLAADQPVTSEAKSDSGLRMMVEPRVVIDPQEESMSMGLEDSMLFAPTAVAATESAPSPTDLSHSRSVTVGLEAPDVLSADLSEAEDSARTNGYTANNMRTRLGRHVDSLEGTERSAIPMSDETPIVYPNPEIWRELADYRIEGYSLVDLYGTEQYEPIHENVFLSARENPQSTFSIDVDTASYTNVRRFLNEGRLPPRDAVRIEEMVNYFRYDYPQPAGDTDGESEEAVPFSVNLESAQCPWTPEHRLVRVGLKGREVNQEQRGPCNLVFLLDVSGSMSDQNKLPLVKQAMTMLTRELTEDDRVSIVTYAGNTRVALESTGGQKTKKIVKAIDALNSGGSTHGSAGIMLAYEQASRNFRKDGNNRVILATDGDLNVGITSDDELVKLIRQKAKTGVFLTVLGFGTGNLKDSKMEKLADHGNGVYAYIDSIREAQRVLVEQVSGSLVTIAKDVKIQIEFNPAEVDSYRLIGYENRVMANEDFANDKKDAGEIGAGHTVTALYEVVPAGLKDTPEEGVGTESSSELKYQQPVATELTEEATSGELLTVKLRYKQPDAKKSKLLEHTLVDSDNRFGKASTEFRFASAVAAFGMLLRGSQYAGDANLAAVEEYAAGALGEDSRGDRAEMLDLIRKTREILGKPTLYPR